MSNRLPALALLAGLLLLIGGSAGGCVPLGALASKSTIIKIKPHYTGLAGQTVAVLVSADPGLRNDFPGLQLDVAGGVNQKLLGAQKAGVDELKGTQFPRDKSPEAVVAFQRNYPALMFEPMVKVAPKLGVSRLIYVEFDSIQTHPDAVPELFRGSASARVQVIEVTGGVGKVAYEDRIDVKYPEDSKTPPEGLPDVGEVKTYRGTIDALTTAVMQRFITYDDNG